MTVQTETCTYKILLVKGEDSNRIKLDTLEREGHVEFDFVLTGSVTEAISILDFDRFDAVVTDYLLADGTVFDIFGRMDDIPVIVVTAGGNEEIAVRAMKAGAYDYIVKNSEGNYLKVLPLTLKNAIERKESERRLKLLEAAIANANDAIVILEAEPEEMNSRKILYVNEAFTRMTGYTFEEVTSKTLRILRGPRTSPSELSKIRLAVEQRKPVRTELVNYRKDGSEFWVECNIVPFVGKDDALLYWVSIQRDITERKKAEEERERLVQEIESVNADLTELNQELETIGTERTMSLMALTIADRIRNPTAMIGCRCRRMLESENIPENLKGSLKHILEGAEKLDAIVKEFEALLKERKNKFRYEDLNVIVERIIPLVAKEASLKGTGMRVNITSEPLRINMQKNLINVAVFHIMKNAVEATPGGNMVTIETFSEGENVVLSVADSGDGIPEGKIPSLFRPSFSTKERSLGMGLPLVKQIVNEHLGELKVDNKPGQGATFQMIFPVRWMDRTFSS